MSVNQKLWDTYVDLINKEVVPALGCTEPVAVALAAARATAVLGKTPERIVARLSRNILKNGMSVGIPGTGLFGLEIAVAAGAVGGDHTRGLEVLSGLNDRISQEAKDLCDAGVVKVELKDTPLNLYIEVEVSSGKDTALVIIQDEHTKITYVDLNGEVLKDDRIPAESQNDGTSGKSDAGLTEKDVWDFAMNAPLEQLLFIKETVRLNNTVSEEGLQGHYGLEVGRLMGEDIESGLRADDLINRAVKRTAGAVDARMAGCPLPVMSNSGSGNQGITATMPVLSVAEDLEAGEEKLVRALILSHLTTIHMKKHLGRLSALCGAVIAGTGSACGMVYLLGGGYPEVESAIKNMVGNVAGMICDGAKNDCALKVASSVHAAGQAALLALKGKVVSPIEGIVHEDIEQTIKNIGRLGSVGMEETDKLILRMMLDKK